MGWDLRRAVAWAGFVGDLWDGDEGAGATRTDVWLCNASQASHGRLNWDFRNGGMNRIAGDLSFHIKQTFFPRPKRQIGLAW